MDKFNSNCFGFVYAALNGDTENQYYKSREDLVLGKKIAKGKVNDSIETTTDEIKAVLENDNESPIKVIEFIDEGKISQHVALLDKNKNFWDQAGPDGPETYGGNIDNLLLWCKNNILGDFYYNIYSLGDKESTLAKKFMDEL